MIRSAMARLCLIAALALLPGCAATIHRAGFTQIEQAQAQIAGIPDARFWRDAPDAPRRMMPPIGRDQPRITMLALSGGGEDGAYGAGLLSGWSSAGTRPEFSLVTGVSTGALIAPFAFLGPRYDATLTRMFTTVSSRDIYRARFPLAILGATSAVSTKPMARLIAIYATDAVIDDVAREHRRGRRLFVGTANLDAQRTVIWDMGAIAASDAPGRYALFRRVLLASAAIPALFPPVMIEAISGARRISEMHVDGGTTAQILVMPTQLVIGGALPRPVSLYLVVNNKLGGDFLLVKPGIVSIAERSFTLNVQSALGSLVGETWLYAQGHSVDFNLAYIGNDFPSDQGSALFDPVYMQGLYAYGRKRGEAGGLWDKRPPGEAAPAKPEDALRQQLP